MWKRLFSWMFESRRDENQQLGLQDLFQEVSVIRKTLRKHTVLLEEVQQGLTALADRQTHEKIKSVKLGYVDALSERCRLVQ